MTLQSSRIVTIGELSKILSKSRTSIWRWSKNNVLPKPLMVNGKTLGWKESTILEWLDNQEVMK
jgi:prophage regulatory protein